MCIRNSARAWFPSLAVIERMTATSCMTWDIRGRPSASWIPGTAESIALVSPPLACPGLGEKVSNWLGPPRMYSRMHAMPRERSSSALALTNSFHPSVPAATLASEMPCRKSRRRITRCAIDAQADVMRALRGSCRLAPLSALLSVCELGGVHQGPQDVFEGFGPIRQVLHVVERQVANSTGFGSRARHRKYNSVAIVSSSALSAKCFSRTVFGVLPLIARDNSGEFIINRACGIDAAISSRGALGS